MDKLVKFIIILIGLLMLIKFIYSATSEHFYLYDKYNNVFGVPDDLVKRYWQRYPLDRTVEMNY
jgi:hypothetical protein